MNTLKFKIEPSPSSNDHQVRLVVDGEDWIGDGNLGIDPPEFFGQPALLQGGNLLVAMCDCGCVGCDDITVEVARKDPGIVWTIREGVFLFFAARDYDQAVKSAMADFSWEDEKRTAERLVSRLFADCEIDDGFRFDWASARIGHGKITLSFSREGQQKTFELGWDGKDPKSALPGAERFKIERVEPSSSLSSQPH